MSATRQCAEPWAPPAPVQRVRPAPDALVVLVVVGVLAFVRDGERITIYCLDMDVARRYWVGDRGVRKWSPGAPPAYTGGAIGTNRRRPGVRGSKSRPGRER